MSWAPCVVSEQQNRRGWGVNAVMPSSTEFFAPAVAIGIVPDFDAKVARHFGMQVPWLNQNGDFTKPKHRQGLRSGRCRTAVKQNTHYHGDCCRTFRENTPTCTHTATTEGADLLGKKERTHTHPLSNSNIQQRKGQTRKKNQQKLHTQQPSYKSGRVAC